MTMSWKNIIENIVLIVVMFIGLGFYTDLVLTPTLVKAIETETTKVENNIDTKIDNKFKKIDELTSNLPTLISPTSSVQQPQQVDAVVSPVQGCDNGWVCVPIGTLSRKQKKILNP